MQVKYGPYPFNADDVIISHNRKVMRSDTGVQYSFVDTWQLQFRLRGDTQTEITSAVETLHSVFSADYGNLVLLQNDGSNSAFITNSAATTSGVKVMNVDFPVLADGQYAYFIDGSVTLEAETVTNVGKDISYSETLSITGNGGPKIILLETARGLPIAQTTRQRTMVRGTQTGSASAIGAVPKRPLILFPNLLINESVQENITVSNQNNRAVYTINWIYPFQSATYFSGTPQAR
jgi:hypothetical protein